LDEHTGIIFDFQAGECQVLGVSSVSLARQCDPEIYAAGASFSLSELGEIRIPEPLDAGIPAEVWEIVTAENEPEDDTPPEEVKVLVKQRQKARAEKNWAASDSLRNEIAAYGWQVQDTLDGQKLVKD
jgi:hypothetical protein